MRILGMWMRGTVEMEAEAEMKTEMDTKMEREWKVEEGTKGHASNGSAALW